MINFKQTVTFRNLIRIFLALIIVYVLLLIPSPSPRVQQVRETSMTKPFIWNQDQRWDLLEKNFIRARRSECDSLNLVINNGLASMEKLLATIDASSLQPAAREFFAIEEQFFSLAPLMGACPERISDYTGIASGMRDAVKRQSIRWNMNDRSARETLYRLLYGERSALEEVILQLPRKKQPSSLLKGPDEPSVTPSAFLLNVPVHSGDILVSRGGAPTSALIARGNDFPGNFSHVALVYVDSLTGKISVIESHIERGVAIATAEDYLRDKKLRVMVLRLRHDLPALKRDPWLPEKAASQMLERALSAHIPYDFSMDYTDPSGLFCSEVASSAYRNLGVNLWMGMSHISSPGLRSWLAAFGVTHFETQEPSDLEYDPQLSVVAEWRDAETLRKDHMDNAVTDAMLERAEQGEPLRYDWYMLPVARILKAYCAVINLLGFEGPIPEGMSAVSSLKHEYYAAKHKKMTGMILKDAEKFRRDRGYEPPYWELLRMARKAY
ncbi:MAG: YiiX/YebB-like N1pC/P60 family cysteine hydrolase [Bacteroidetes bacterium]|nr:YiiX/YebB-like N1pC/P60 family cysteine hydrolase [Bacteroidota bacterium]